MNRYFNYMDEWLRTEKNYIWLLIIAISVLIGMFIESLTSSRWIQAVSTGTILIILSSIRAYTKKINNNQKIWHKVSKQIAVTFTLFNLIDKLHLSRYKKNQPNLRARLIFN